MSEKYYVLYMHIMEKKFCVDGKLKTVGETSSSAGPSKRRPRKAV